ncbi:hypothetical protein [Marinospirillum perlucidum]|uniref:hypothetical protein n=1 Tax=Marinospirillum perlucidum TaxID=1982602 RepID=UPI000DF32E97|nr:hypothetical protein [Marinospirillum perlucidum]
MSILHAKNKVFFDFSLMLVIVLVLFTLYYLWYINFALPIMTWDEFQNGFKSADEQLAEILKSGRLSHFLAYPINAILKFVIPEFSAVLPRYFALIMLPITLVALLIILRVSKKKSFVVAFLPILMHQLDWQHNGQIAFFGSYNVYAALFIIAIILDASQKFDESMSIHKWIFGFIVSILAFASELFFIAAGFYIFLKIINYRCSVTVVVRSPLCSAVAVYGVFLITVIFYNFNASNAEAEAMGNYLYGSVNTASVYNLLKITLLYAVNSIPYLNTMGFDVFGKLVISVVIVSILSVFAFRAIVSIINKTATHKSIIFLVSLLIYFGSSFLLSLQPIKSQWMLDNHNTRYVFNFYGWLILYLILFFAIDRYCKNVKSSIPFNIFVVASIVFAVYSINENIKFVDRYSESKDKWIAIDQIAENSIANNQKEVGFHIDYLVHPDIVSFSRDSFSRFIDFEYNLDAKYCYAKQGSRLNLYGVLPRYFSIEGFYSPEINWVWVGSSSMIRIDKEYPAGTIFDLELGDVFPGKTPKNVRFLFNGEPVNKLISGQQIIRFQTDSDSSYIEIKIQSPEEASPLELGYGDDSRRLSLQLISLGVILPDGSMSSFCE